MNTFASVESLAWPIAAPSVRTKFAFPDCDSLPAGQYQVALLSMDMYRPGNNGKGRDAAISQIFLLPLTWNELLDHVQSQAERRVNTRCADIEQFGDVRVDFLRHEAQRAGELIVLTAFDFKLLRFFLSNPFRVISREELLETVWGYNCYPSTRTVDNKILQLRQKLEPEPGNPVHFRTVHRVGYKFVP